MTTLRLRRLLLGLAVVLTLFLVAARLIGLQSDPPYGIATNSGALITDEGWYSKSAQSLARMGELRHPMDRNIYTHTLAYTLTTSVAFGIGGVSLITARLVSVAAFWVSLVLFYLISRTSQPRTVALLACLVITAEFQAFSFSRLALAEPLGVAFSLGALYVWVRDPASRRSSMMSMALACLALLTKLSFVFTPITMFILTSSSTVRSGGPESWRARWRFVLPVLLTGALAVAILTGLSKWHADDWQTIQEQLEFEQTQALGIFDILRHEYQATRDILVNPGSATLAWSLLICGSILVLQQRKQVLAELLRPGVLAMLTWLASGLYVLSAFNVQPARYYYFLLFPLAYLAFEGTRWAVKSKYRIAAAAIIVLLSLGEQSYKYLSWWNQGLESTYAQAAGEIAEIITEGSRDTVVLLGLNASFVSLFHDDIRPLELALVPRPTICERIDFWRPSYLIHFADPLKEILPLCPSVIAEIEVSRSFKVMQNWYFGSDMVLATIHYREDSTTASMSVDATRSGS